MIGRTRRRHTWLHRQAEPAVSSPATPVTIDVTTEARWFLDGPIPAEVRTWFTRGDTTGLAETRTDLYRVDPHTDLGLKLRSRVLLELKLRLGAPMPFVLDGEHSGVIERWQRWSPADDRVNLDEHARWQAVDKVIVKRRFDPSGTERELTEAQRAMTGRGCDVEIAEIRVDGDTHWSFAFAAFGPLETHRRSIEHAWETLARGDRVPVQVQLTEEGSSGYPHWLNRADADPDVVDP